MNRKKFLWYSFVIAIALIFSAVVFLFSLRFIPHDFLERQIISRANKKNLPLSALKITKFDAHNFAASAIKFTGEESPKIENLQLGFSLPSLLSGRVNLVAADEIKFALKRGENGIYISGLDGFQAFAPEDSSPKNNENLFEICRNFYSRLPEEIDISNLKISFADENFSIFLPLNLKFSAQKNSVIEINSSAWNLKFLNYQLQSDSMKFFAKKDEANVFLGELSIPNIKINGHISHLPDINAQIKFSLSPQKIISAISIFDLKNTISAQMNFSLPNNDFPAGNISLQNLHFPFAGGVISHADFNSDLNVPIQLNFALKNLRLDEIFTMLSENKIKATGRVSGNLPISYHPDKGIAVENGELENISPGVLKISPEIFPQDNQQLKMLSEVLQNFHYTKLKIFVISARDLRLQLEGKNPSALNAAPVKLNVNLTGDMLPLLQKGNLVFNDVQKFLLQESQ